MALTLQSPAKSIEATTADQASHASGSIVGAALESQLFIGVIRRLLRDGEAHLANRDASGGPPPEPSSWGWRDGRPCGVGIGWTDNRLVCLEPRLAYAAAQRKALRAGQCLLTPLTLWRRLASAGLLARRDADRNLMRIRVDGRQPRVVALAAHLLRPVPIQSPPPQPVDPAAAERRARQWASCEDGLRKILAVFETRGAQALTGQEIERGLPWYWRGLQVVRVDAFLGSLRLRPMNSWIGVPPHDYRDWRHVHQWSRASIERAHRKAVDRLRRGA